MPISYASKAAFLSLIKCNVHAYYFCISFAVPLPRYARVNSLKTDRNEVEENFARHGYQLVSQKDFNSHRHLSHDSFDSFYSKFCRDSHLPDLLVFCSCVPLTETKLYSTGSIVLQDKVRIILYVHVW